MQKRSISVPRDGSQVQPRLRLPLMIICLLVSSSIVHCTDEISVLLIGQVTREHCPAPIWFDSEPQVDYLLVPTKLFGLMDYHDAQRFIRLYFPRSRTAIEKFDFTMFINPYFEPFTPSQIEQMRLAIVETGRPAFQTLGGLTIDWINPNRPWLLSTLAPIFPNDPDAYLYWELNKKGVQPYRLEVNRDPVLPPVLKMFIPLGIEDVRGYIPGATIWGGVLMVPQEGATIWARAKGTYPKASEEPPPWFLSWDYGNATTWSVADDLDCVWWSSTYYYSDQKYGLDILMNMMLHSLGKDLPEDIVLINYVRQGFQMYRREASDMVAILDFVELFGANINPLLEETTRTRQAISAAESLYLEKQYQEALDEVRLARKALVDIQDMAIELKDQALLWVYIIEWAVVSGTSLIAGLALYALMLKRRLYRDTGATRFSG